jgi:quercetin dioxygenase-like cupin family protein
MDDRELNHLLREWRAPDAPVHLRAPRRQGSWLRWLLTGTIRVPVPLAFAAVLLAALWVASSWREPLSPVPSTPRRSGELARYPLTGRLEGFDAVLLELNMAPGTSAPAHRHPGFIFGYVMDGQMRSAVNHEPDQIVPAGGTFFEPEGALHTTFGASADAPVRAVAFLVVPSGNRRLTTPADASSPPVERRK